jgi:hypothetical protein
MPLFGSLEVDSKKFSWLAKSLSLDELEVTLDNCNNFCLGLEGLMFSRFKELTKEQIVSV